VDVILMDVRMPLLGGIAATAALRDAPDPAQVLVLTTFGEDDVLWVAVYRAGSGSVCSSR
jgi:DNA-binding NarL/FixJ family response regulator